MYNITDGGKTASGFTHESNDCTVRAISIAYGKSYAEAHAIMKDWGRKDGQPAYGFVPFMMKHMPHQWMKRQKEIKRTVRCFIRENPVGTFILRTQGHVFAVIDGVIHDSYANNPRKHLKQVWRIK